jgi:hypothetical protein
MLDYIDQQGDTAVELYIHALIGINKKKESSTYFRIHKKQLQMDGCRTSKNIL